jgi:hypothetical protein
VPSTCKMLENSGTAAQEIPIVSGCREDYERAICGGMQELCSRLLMNEVCGEGSSSGESLPSKDMKN